MKNNFIDEVKKAIKLQRWDKSSYVYAMNAIEPYCYWDMYLKKDLIAKFFEQIVVEKQWNKIKDFTTFKNVSYN